MPTPTLLHRLKERKLVQWALAYLAGAFVVLQIIDALETPLGLSAMVQQALLALLVVGFFITLVLAWYHGEKGRQRVSGPELLMVAVLLLIAGGVVSRLGGPEESPFPYAQREGDDRPGIAVFPCENWSPDPDDAYFASGIHDEILLRLSKIGGLRSIGRESMEWYDARSLPTRQVAQELSVGYLGECSVLKDTERNQVRLTFQLIDGNTGTQIWAERYDEGLSVRSIFDIHTDLATRVARAVGVVVTQEETARIEDIPTSSLGAYELYLKGRDRWATRSPEGIRGAIDYFETAIALDSTFVLAWIGLADAYQVLPWWEQDTNPGDVYEQAKGAAERALELNPLAGEAHATLGNIALIYELDWEAAELHLRTAVELAPGYAFAHYWYSNVLVAVGRFDEAVDECETGLALEPRSNVMVWGSGDRFESAGRLGEARARYEQAIAMDPPAVWAFQSYAVSLGLADPTDPARASSLLTEFATLLDYPTPDRMATVAEAMTGPLEVKLEAQEVLEDLVKNTRLDRADLLVFYAASATLPVFFDVLEEAIEQMNYWVAFMPNWLTRHKPNLLAHSRWEAIESRIGIPVSGS